jgi:hypothetical protein
VKWHRTPKSAIFDFCYDTGDFDIEQFPQYEKPWYVIDGLHGLSILDEAVNRVVSMAIEKAIKLF